MRQSLVQDDGEAGSDSGVESEETSLEEDTTKPLNTESGFVLDSDREVRVKLYYGQVNVIALTATIWWLTLSFGVGLHGVVLVYPGVPYGASDIGHTIDTYDFASNEERSGLSAWDWVIPG